MQLTGTLPGLLGKIAKSGGTLSDYAEMRGVAHMFRFLGSVPDPVPILEACDALVRPSRSSDPWGREVLEAMSHGLPVLSVGEYDTFVEHGVTGFLYSEFDAASFADDIVALSEKSDVRVAMGEASHNRISTLCDGPEMRIGTSSSLAQTQRARLMQQIVFVLPSFAGGGAERVVIGLANGLNRDRYEPVMIVLENKGPLASDLDESIQVISLERPRLRQAVAPLRRILQEMRPSVVMSTMGYLNLGILWAARSERNKTRNCRA